MRPTSLRLTLSRLSRFQDLQAQTRYNMFKGEVKYY